MPIPDTNRARSRCVVWIARSFLPVVAWLLATDAGNAQTAALGCSDFLLDRRISLAASLQDAGAKKLEPPQAEAACRDALRADPANPDRMFQLARALALANKQLEAIRYYLDAADRGHARAMNDLGGVFEYGTGVPKNLSTAIEWYERAAGAGHVGAMAHLGELNEDANGPAPDLANARRWYEKAAALGDAASMNALANLLKQAGELAAAVDWYRKSAEHGSASAMNSLGELSEAGVGVAQDYASARNWYRKAADLGHADAMGHLGALLESGRGGPQNLDASREWYVRGAALNGPVAMHNLGSMLENGRGTARNVAQAKMWYERAAGLGYPPALTALGRLSLEGAGVAKDYARAKTLFEQAAELGDAKAMNNLGVLYLEGRGVLRDIAMARTWFERAVALDNAEARHNLERLDQAGLTDGSQIAARRASCMQTCAELQRSYVSSACGPYSSTVSEENPDRTRCIETGLSLASKCRGTCREWASTLSPDNKCLICFRSMIACSAGVSRAGEGDEKPDALGSSDCLESLEECTTGCSRDTTSSRIAN